MKHKLSSFLIGDLILFAALLLAPPLSGIFRIVQTVLLLLSGLAALWLIVQISRQKETISGVLLLKLEPCLLYTSFPDADVRADPDRIYFAGCRLRISRTHPRLYFKNLFLLPFQQVYLD